MHTCSNEQDQERINVCQCLVLEEGIRERHWGRDDGVSDGVVRDEDRGELLLAWRAKRATVKCWDAV